MSAWQNKETYEGRSIAYVQRFMMTKIPLPRFFKIHYGYDMPRLAKSKPGKAGKNQNADSSNDGAKDFPASPKATHQNYEAAFQAGAQPSHGSSGQAYGRSLTFASLKLWASQTVPPEESKERQDVAKLIAYAAGFDLADTSADTPLILKKSLHLHGLKLVTALPDGLTAEGDVTITNCPALRSLPKNSSFKGSLIIDECENIRTIPSDTDIGKDLKLTGLPMLQNIGERLKIGESLWIEGCKTLGSLGQHLTVGKHFVLHDCWQLNFIGKDIDIGESAYFASLPSLKSLPNGLQIKRSLVIATCQNLVGRLDTVQLGQGGPLASVIRNLDSPHQVSLNNLIFSDSLELIFDHVPRADRYRMVASIQAMLSGAEHVSYTGLHKIFNDFSRIPSSCYADVVAESTGYSHLRTLDQFPEFAACVSELCDEALARSQERTRNRAHDHTHERRNSAYSDAELPPTPEIASEAAAFAYAEPYFKKLRRATGSKAILELVYSWRQDKTVHDAVSALAELVGKEKTSSPGSGVRWLDAVVGETASAGEAKNTLKNLTRALHPDKSTLFPNDVSKETKLLAEHLFLICHHAWKELG